MAGPGCGASPSGVPARGGDGGPSMYAMPILVFDGDCGFCTAATEWLAPRLERRTRFLPWQQAELERLGLSAEAAKARVWWVESSGERYGGHEAIAQALRACGGGWRGVGRLLTAPGLSWLAARGYEGVSALRRHLPGTTPACRGGGRSFGGPEQRAPDGVP
jgi:predicted DCC family thiol-disulfide oxidoreductase YuxK